MSGGSRLPSSDPAMHDVSHTVLSAVPAPIIARMASDEVTNVIAANHALGQTMAISGTPTFVMGGQMLRGYVPLDGMVQIIADERAG